MDTGVWVPRPRSGREQAFRGDDGLGGDEGDVRGYGLALGVLSLILLKFRGLQDGLTKARAQP